MPTGTRASASLRQWVLELDRQTDRRSPLLFSRLAMELQTLKQKLSTEKTRLKAAAVEHLQPGQQGTGGWSGRALMAGMPGRMAGMPVLNLSE